MSHPKIKRNAIKCKTCGDIIESKHTHDFVTSSCQSCSVDGRLSYVTRPARTLIFQRHNRIAKNNRSSVKYQFTLTDG